MRVKHDYFTFMIQNIDGYFLLSNDDCNLNLRILMTIRRFFEDFIIRLPDLRANAAGVAHAPQSISAGSGPPIPVVACPNQISRIASFP